MRKGFYLCNNELVYVFDIFRESKDAVWATYVDCDGQVQEKEILSQFVPITKTKAVVKSFAARVPQALLDCIGYPKFV